MVKQAKVYLSPTGILHFMQSTVPAEDLQEESQNALLESVPSTFTPNKAKRSREYRVPADNQHTGKQPRFTELNNLFDDFMAVSGKPFREMKDRCTLQFCHNNQTFFIKKHFGVGWFEIFKELFHLRLPTISAANEWHAVQRLHDLGIATIDAVAYGRCGWNPAHIKSFIVSKALTGCISLQDWGEQHFAGVTSKRTVTLQLAALTRQLHHHGINHRDYYFCHLWWHIEQQQLYVMDLHRAQLRDHTPQRWLIKDIAGLYFCSLGYRVTRRDYLRFLKHYFDMPLRQLFQQHHSLLKKIEQRAIKLYKKCHHSEPIVDIL